MDNVEKEFRKIFGDMYLSDSETALRIFEYGYKAGLERAMQMIQDKNTSEVVKGNLND